MPDIGCFSPICDADFFFVMSTLLTFSIATACFSSPFKLFVSSFAVQNFLSSFGMPAVYFLCSAGCFSVFFYDTLFFLFYDAGVFFFSYDSGLSYLLH